MSVFMIWNGAVGGYEGCVFHTRTGAEEYIKTHRPPNIFWEVAEIRFTDAMDTQPFLEDSMSPFIVACEENSVSCASAQEVAALIASAPAGAFFSVTHMGYEEFFFAGEKPSEGDIRGAFEDAPRWARAAAKKEARDKERV